VKNLTFIFGFVMLDTISNTNELENLLNNEKILRIHSNNTIGGMEYCNMTIVIDFARNMKGVEKYSVIHLSLQFLNEPWPYGMDIEKSDIRKNTTDVMLHLIQPRFRNIFGEHYYRTVISDLQKTPNSMVVHAYILLDPDKDNLYHSYTVWFAPEGYVYFGKWILFPANINVERALVVPNRYWKYLSDRSYMAPMAFDTRNPIYTVTIPAFLIGSTTIMILIGSLSLYHYFAYSKVDKRI